MSVFTRKYFRLSLTLFTAISMLSMLQFASWYSRTSCSCTPTGRGVKTSEYNFVRETTEAIKNEDIMIKQPITEEFDRNEPAARPLKLVSGFGTNVILLSAIAGNLTSNSTWDKIAITAWEAKQLENQTYMCCVGYRSGTIRTFPANKLNRDETATMTSRQFVCEINGTDLHDLPLSATVVDEKNPVCYKYTASYVDVEYAHAHPGEVAAFGKVVYGNISAHDLVVWIEIHKLFGVNKFLIYPYDIPSDSMRVLRYYERRGVVDMIPLVRPATGLFESVGWYQYTNDQKVAEYDGLQRLKGYKYMVNFDIDEYIIPRKGESWLDLFDRLFKTSPDAGSFRFKSYIFVESWGPTNTACPFRVCRYSMRTDITLNTPKLVSNPSRIKDTGLSTHFNLFKDGYKTYDVNHEDAAIHHYRVCRYEWLRKNTDFPCYNVTRNYDDTVVKLFKRVEKRVREVIAELEI